MILSFEGAVTEIIEWVRVDTGVVLDRKAVVAAYIEDLGTIGNRGLTAAECELIILGSDDGQIPSVLISRFPKLCAFLDSELT